MFNKKIVPDFSPRQSVKINTVSYSVPVQETHLPEKILISDSEKLPLILPVVPPPRVQSHTAPKKVAFMIPQIAPQETPLAQNPPEATLAPAASFSPSLETFPATNSSYFKLSSDAGADAARWSLFPAISTINANEYSIEHVDTITALSTITSTISVTSGAIRMLDNVGTNVLEAIGGDLFFNTELLAKAGDIQDIADWSLYPALSTINVNSNDLSNVSTINGIAYPPPGTNVSQWATFPATTNVNMGSNQIGGNGSYLQFSSNAVTVGTLLETNTLASLGGTFGTAGQYLTSDGTKIQWTTPVASGVTSLNAQTGTVAITSAGSSVAITNPTPGTINLETTTIGAPSWANYPAVSNVLIPDHDLTLTSANTGISYRNATLDANVTIGNPALSIGLLPNFSALVANFNIGSITQPTTSVNVTSVGNVNILGGAGVSIAGGGGVSVSGVGGVAVTGAGAVSVQGGGISVNGGAVSLTGSSALSVAAGGVVVNGGGVAINGGGVAVNAGALTIASGTIDVGTIAAAGGGVNVFGSDIIMTPVGPATATLKTNRIAGYTPGSLAITDVSTINGVAYPPTGSGVTSLNTVSGALTLAAGPSCTVSTIGTTITVDAPTLGLSTDVGDVTCWGVANTAFSVGNVAVLNAATAQNTADQALLQSGVTNVNSAVGGINIVAGSNISVGTIGSVITINATGGGGATGATGPTGPTGPAGGSSSYFNYQAQVPPAVPTSGHITWQSTSQTTSTYIQVNHISNDGVDIELFLTAVQVGTTLIIQNQDDSTNYQKWTVSSAPIIVPNNYVQYPVTLQASAGLNFANNHRIILAILSTGVSGPTGPTGPTGPVNVDLVNKVIATSVGTPVSTPLTWSTGQAASQYVPLAADTSVTYRPPTAPVSGTGWRFTKTYALLAVAALPAPATLVSGSTYSIVTPGTVNWTGIGATAATAGTQFTYSGGVITGTGGTAVETSKISWYSRNALYGLALPQTLAPVGSFSKANLQNAWFLVKFNADIALQGSLAIQIDTYAYQYSGNTTNSFTGRWAYSFPLQQSVGFNAGAATNINTGGSPGLFSGRLRAGFTYLLYAGDYSTVGAAGPLQPPSSQYLPAGAGLFAPSQALLANTLKDPYDIYPEYPHFGLTSCLYIANATQPPYGGVNPYSDQAAVEVASIYLNTNSTSPTSGVGQTVTDFQVMAMGYTSSTGSFTFPTSWV